MAAKKPVPPSVAPDVRVSVERLAELDALHAKAKADYLAGVANRLPEKTLDLLAEIAVEYLRSARELRERLAPRFPPTRRKQL